MDKILNLEGSFFKSFYHLKFLGWSSRFRTIDDLSREMRQSLDAICMPNTMVLDQAVLEILYSQGPLWVKCLSLKRGIIQSNIYRIIRKVNRIIFIMYPNCMPDIMILAQGFLQILCSQDCSSIQYGKIGKGRPFSQIFTEFFQKLIRSYILWTLSICQIS